MKVSELYVHPIKSFKPVRVSSVELSEFGVLNDRKWMVITQENRYQGLKHNPKMALITCNIEGNFLTLNAEGMPELKILILSDDEDKRPTFTLELFNATCEVVDEGIEASKWLTRFLVSPENQAQQTLRLVRSFTKNIKRPSEAKLEGADSKILFADAFPVLVISQASQDNLNAKLKSPIAVTRFRPNIVVAGAEAFPHIEDDWQEIEINGIKFKIAEQCARCKVPTATETGVYDKDNEPTATLKQYRSIKHMVFFGNYFFHMSRGAIHEGDEIHVIKSAPWTAIKDAQQAAQVQVHQPEATPV